jgi:hypothetical protein
MDFSVYLVCMCSADVLTGLLLHCRALLQHNYDMHLRMRQKPALS